MKFASIRRFAGMRLFEYLKYLLQTFIVNLYGFVLTGKPLFHLLVVVDELFVDCHIQFFDSTLRLFTDLVQLGLNALLDVVFKKALL